LRLIFPTEGRALILGRDWRDSAVRARIGFLPEQPYFYDYLTASELLNYYGQLSGLNAKLRSRRVGEVLNLVGLPDVGGVQPAQVSANQNLPRRN